MVLKSCLAFPIVANENAIINRTRLKTNTGDALRMAPVE